MMSSESPFFDIPRSEWIASNRSAFAVWDTYPVNPGTCARRHHFARSLTGGRRHQKNAPIS